MNPYLHYFLAAHNVLRYAVIITAILAAAFSLLDIQGKKPLSARTRKAALFTLISCDLQLLMGLAVYYLGGHILMLKQGGVMSNPTSRFFAIEHPLTMVIGIVLVHFAYNVTKGHLSDGKKLKRVFWATFVALFLFLARTPWPSNRPTSRPWLPVSSVLPAASLNA